MRRIALSLCLSFTGVVMGAFVSWGQAETPRYRLAEAPARLRPGIETANAAIATLQGRLTVRLLDELKGGGPSQAIGVCRDEAPTLTAEAGRAHGVRTGRTSHRLRNQGNAAPEWAAPLVAQGDGMRAADVESVAVDLGGSVGVLRPISVGPACIQCHGPSERLGSGVAALLRASYPTDEAIGFAEGDLRGYFWAEVPIEPETGAAPATPVTEGAAAADDADAVARGKRWVSEANPRCSVCHSLEGKGNPQGPLDGVGARLSGEDIKGWIRTPAEMRKKYDKPRRPPMVPFPEFSDEELEDIVRYLQSLTPPAERK